MGDGESFFNKSQDGPVSLKKMPRFHESSVACLKHAMLAKAPTFRFSPEDVQQIIQNTGLNQAQVQVWAENFRMRYVTEKDKLDFLKADAAEKPVRDHPRLWSFRVSKCFQLQALAGVT